MRPLTPEVVLNAYAQGVFPMADGRDDPTLFWVDPDRRGILPLDAFHVPRRLARTVRADRFQISADRAFDRVIRACATPVAGRRNSWINERIVRLYCALHRRGNAHSIECWDDGELAGGLYGVALGGAFFGESMFSGTRDASKVALVHLVARLVAGRYRLLDTQFVTEHLARFGALEIDRADYLGRLQDAIAAPAEFDALPPHGIPGSTALTVIAGSG